MSDRARTALAFAIIIGILLVWTLLNKPSAPVPSAEPPPQDTLAPPPEPVIPAAVDIAPPTEELTVIERPAITVVLSDHGGSVVSFRLKAYDIDIVPPDRRLFLSRVTDSLGTLVRPTCHVAEDSVAYIFEHAGQQIVKTYRFDQEHGFSLRISGGDTPHFLDLKAGLNVTETGNPGDDMRNFNVYVRNEKLQTLTGRIKDSLVYTAGFEWIALRTKYFILALSDVSGIDALTFKKITGAPARSETDAAAFGCYHMGGGNNRYGALLRGGSDIELRVLLLPMDHRVLAQYGKGYEAIASGGFWGPISNAIMFVLRIMHSIIGNYGFAIMLFALLIKLIFFPLSRQMVISQHKMQAIQPELKKIQQKYKSDPQRLNQEMMHLYKAYKVNPLSGCLPLLIQMPIFFALFRTLTTSIEFRQAPFMLWITDLSLRDPYYVLPISMGVMMLIQSLTTTVDPRQRLMVIFMPIVMVWIFINLPSGLQLYWFTYNILTLIEHFLIKRGGYK